MFNILIKKRLCLKIIKTRHGKRVFTIVDVFQKTKIKMYFKTFGLSRIHFEGN